MIDKSTTVLYYIKYPDIPFMDYYIDVNGVYQFLEENDIHLWDDGEIDSYGNSHNAGDSNYTSRTVELNWKKQDRIKIAERILRTMGVRLNEKQLFEYAQQSMMES
jgi:hypothetical protein